MYFRVTSHIYGGVWLVVSPHMPYIEHLMVINVVMWCLVYKFFYVDDCLTYARHEQEARLIIPGVRSVPQNSGFKPTQFVISDMMLNFLNKILPCKKNKINQQ